MISLLQHQDDRVRVEAVRGCVPLLGHDAAAPYLEQALMDQSDRVREAAATLLMAVRRSGTPQAILRAINEGPGLPEEKARLVEVLARDSSNAATDALTELAQRKVAFRGAARIVRDAARKALKRRSRLAG